MTRERLKEHLPQCERDAACERPASVTVYDLTAARWIHACRPHRREVNRLNARYVGHCQYTEMIEGMRADHCQNFPVTMRYVEGEDMAVCARHDSHINQHFASRRNTPQQNAS